MSLFLSKILVPRLMREAGMSDADEERAMTKIIEKLRIIKNNENNCGRVEDVDEEHDHDGDASKKLKETSVEKTIRNKYEAAIEVRLREKPLKKPVVEVPSTDSDSTIMSSEFNERKRKRKPLKKKSKSSIGRSGEGSSSRNNKINNPRESEPAPPLPIQFKNAILALARGRTVSEQKLVIQKQLFASDMAKDQNRLTIPENQIREEFLSNAEKVNLSRYERKGRKMAMEVKIIEPLLGEGSVELRRWELKKYSGNSSSSYVLNKTWGKIRENNRLELGDVMQLWAVRVDGELLFVLVKLA